MTKTLAILNHKGGIGKTTLTCTLGHALAKDKQVLIIDNDTQTNASNLLIPDIADTKKTLYDIYNPDIKNIDPEHYIYPTKYKNLWCLPNHRDTGSLEAKFFRSSEYPKNLFILKQLLGDYINNFDYVLIDNAPSLGAFVICSLCISDLVIVPTKAGSTFSIEGVANAVELIREIKEEMNPNLKLLKLLVNQVDKRTTTSQYTIERLKQHFGDEYLFKTTIPTNASFEKSEMLKKTILSHAGSAPGAKAYRNLCIEVINLLKAN